MLFLSPSPAEEQNYCARHTRVLLGKMLYHLDPAKINYDTQISGNLGHLAQMFSPTRQAVVNLHTLNAELCWLTFLFALRTIQGGVESYQRSIEIEQSSRIGYELNSIERVVHIKGGGRFSIV